MQKARTRPNQLKLRTAGGMYIAGVVLTEEQMRDLRTLIQYRDPARATQAQEIMLLGGIAFREKLTEHIFCLTGAAPRMEATAENWTIYQA